MRFDDRPSTTSSKLVYGDGRQSSSHSDCGKDDQDWSEDEYAPSSAAAVTENSQHNQHHRSIRAFHRASVVSAPSSTARSGSFSMAGVYYHNIITRAPSFYYHNLSRNDPLLFIIRFLVCFYNMCNASRIIGRAGDQSKKVR